MAPPHPPRMEQILEFTVSSRVAWTHTYRALSYIRKNAFFTLDMTSSSASVSSGCSNKVPQTGWLKQQKHIFSQFWRLEVWDQHIGRLGVFWGLSPWLADGHFLTASLQCTHGQSSLVSLPLLLWTLVLLNWNRFPPLWPQLILITSLKALSPNIVTLGPQHNEFWGDTSVHRKGWGENHFHLVA